MKKRTKSRSRNSSVLFILAILLCTAGALYSSRLFFFNFTKSLFKNEDPVATITFKYKTAQRKFLGRTVWDRLRQQSPVYNGDTIHTSALSEATIWFSDGNIMEISENTMAQIFIQKDDSLKADLLDGSAFIDSSGSERGAVISSGGVEVALKKGASLSAKSKDGAVSLQMVSGEGYVGGRSISKGSSLSVDAGGELEEAFSILSPRLNEKILYHDDILRKIDFEWMGGSSGSSSELTLVLSENKSFTSVIKTVSVTGLSSFSMELDSGTYYWKISSPDKEFAQGKLQLIKSPSPQLVTPVKGYEYSFRSKKPAVRLIWSESPAASAYRLVVADNPGLNDPVIEQRTSSTSAIISTLGNGNWYWQVTPYYSVNRIGFEAPSETGNFIINRKERLSAPDLVVPFDNTALNSAGTGRAQVFSWRQDSEAVSYNILISSKSDLSSPYVNESVSENFYRFDGKKNKVLPDGTWYWGVSKKDAEGNMSAVSEIRKFFVLKGEMEQHLVEPLDGYSIAESIIKDIKFTWKCNIPAGFSTEFQIAADSGFSKKVYSAKVNSGSISGPELKDGKYWWRIVSRDAGGENEIATQARAFNVIANLGHAAITAPLGKVVSHENYDYSFMWTAVKDADFYKFNIYRSSDNALVYEDNVYETVARVDLFAKGLKDKEHYRFEVQPKAVALDGIRTRLSGQTSAQNFVLIKIKPVDISYPSEKAVLDGLAANMQPLYLKWDTDDKVQKAQVIITRIDERNSKSTEILHYPSDRDYNIKGKNAPREIAVNSKGLLKSGAYNVNIHAINGDGYDISRSKHVFYVSAIPKLPAPEAMKVHPEKIDKAYLLGGDRSMELNFKWKPVSEATEYKFKILRTDGRGKREKVICDKVMKDPSFVLNLMDDSLNEEDRRGFMKGKYRWTVEAIRLIDFDGDGIAERKLQDGKISEGYFETDIPAPKLLKTMKPKNPYSLTK